MFGPPGHLYVYFTYGMHWCANAVCGPGTIPHAVLLRAGGAARRSRRDARRGDRAARAATAISAPGPARLAQAFGIDRALDGADLVRGPVRIVDDGVAPPRRPGVSTRIGLSVGRGEDLPWRYTVTGDPNLS